MTAKFKMRSPTLPSLQIHSHSSEVDHHSELLEEVLADDSYRAIALVACVHRKRLERAGPFVDPDLDVLDFRAPLLRSAEALQGCVVDARREVVDGQGPQLNLVEIGDLAACIEHEDVPPVLLNRSSD